MPSGAKPSSDGDLRADLHVVRTDHGERAIPETAEPAPVAPPESVRGKHVLVVGINYAPEQTGIAPYTTQIAEYLALSAASVTVLCGPPSYPAWKVAPEYRRWRLRERRNKVTVIRLRHYVPTSQTVLRRGLYEGTFGARVLGQRLPHRPDLVFAVTPSLGGAAAAALMAKRYRAPLVLQVQDLLGKAATQSGMDGGSRVAVVSEGFVETVKHRGAQDDRVTLVRNWTHVSPPTVEREEMRRRLGWPEGVTVSLHTGNMGLKQDLGNIVEAARLSRDRTDLLWVLIGDGSQREAPCRSRRRPPGNLRRRRR